MVPGRQNPAAAAAKTGVTQGLSYDIKCVKQRWLVGRPMNHVRNIIGSTTNNCKIYLKPRRYIANASQKSGASPKHHQHITKPSPKHRPRITKTQPKYEQASPKYYQNITQTLPKHCDSRYQSSLPVTDSTCCCPSLLTISVRDTRVRVLKRRRPPPRFRQEPKLVACHERSHVISSCPKDYLFLCLSRAEKKRE